MTIIGAVLLVALDCRPSGGWAADREAAMAAFREAWDRWLAALNDESAQK